MNINEKRPRSRLIGSGERARSQLAARTMPPLIRLNCGRWHGAIFFVSLLSFCLVLCRLYAPSAAQQTINILERDECESWPIKNNENENYTFLLGRAAFRAAAFRSDHSNGCCKKFLQTVSAS